MTDKKAQPNNLAEMFSMFQLDRSRRRWRFIALILLVLFILFNAGKFEAINSNEEFIARINIHGIIVEDTEQEERILKLANNPNIKAVIVHVDSPGGTMVGGLSVFHALENINKVKPVVVVMGTTAASAGYLISLAGSHIIANEATVTGSIGVLMPLVDASELAGKIGIKSNFITSGDLKSAGMPIEKLTPKSKEYLQNTVNKLESIFLGYVVKHRNITPTTQETVKDGRAIIGADAISLGLIDEIGGLTNARDWLAKNYKIGHNIPVRVIELKKETGLVKELLSETKTMIQPLQYGLTNGFWAIKGE